MEAIPFDIAIGLDRSDKTADLHLIQVKDAQAEHQRIATDPEALQGWVTELRAKYPGQRVAICVEQPANNLIVFLPGFEFITLYAINAITLQKFREAFVTSRAKSDAQDAFYLAKLLVTHHATLKAWAPDDAPTRRLQRLVTDPAHRSVDPVPNGNTAPGRRPSRHSFRSFARSIREASVH